MLEATGEQIEIPGETYRANAVAQKREAHIFAEMLGLACHRDTLYVGNKWYIWGFV
jgi:hypothetical protein